MLGPMKRPILATAVLILGGPMSFLQAKTAPPKHAEMEFAWRMYGELSQDPGNLFFSPYSVAAALGMMAGGARGETAEEFSRLLGVRRAMRKAAGAHFEWIDANALWVQREYKLQPDFVAKANREFDATVEAVDFSKDPGAASSAINDWTSKATRGKITRLVDSSKLTPLTRLVLTNAIYFKAKWDLPFKEDFTEMQPFHGTSGTSKVPLMLLTDHFAYAEDAQAQLLELPYEGKGVSMLVLLPKKVDGLAALEKTLSASSLDAWLAKRSSEEVTVWLPKFKLDYDVELKPALESLGLRSAFVQPSDPVRAGQADFSGISGKPELMIGAVIHKAFVEVDERGTEAAAATAIAMAAGAAMPHKIVEFKADHPFLFFIRDNASGAVLFAGRFVSP